MRHEPTWLSDYLVADVEDPRLNLQSVLSRHFLIRALTGDRLGGLMEQECQFAAVMNWLLSLARPPRGGDDLVAVLHALRCRADNAEGIEIPQFVLQTFSAFPLAASPVGVPNYLERFLADAPLERREIEGRMEALDTFRDLWRRTLNEAPASAADPDGRARLSVLEVACGSANDYRFLDAYGIGRLIDYTGLDLCAKNVANAQALFPGVRFAVGNAFELAAPDKSFDLCIVHDLFEHLSLEGMEAALGEICRVTRRGLCIGFFNMDEIGEHRARPVEEYHWNTLSMARVKESFARHGFAAQVLHIGSWLRQQVGCEHTHNPNAYTFWLRPA
jgi:ubiquinone/menaquinone biosynthesis C-methylase UbiE